MKQKKRLFTKQEIQKLINEGKDLEFFKDYIGFEDIGQGYWYKSVEAWNSDDTDVIVYIPEYCYSEIEDNTGTRVLLLEIDSCYTKQDFINITGDLEKAEYLFESVDWQHPTTLWDEWDIKNLYYYYDIHVSYGKKDGDGYSIFIFSESQNEKEVIQKAIDEEKFEYEDDINYIDYVIEITKEEYDEVIGNNI